MVCGGRWLQLLAGTAGRRETAVQRAHVRAVRGDQCAQPEAGQALALPGQRAVRRPQRALGRGARTQLPAAAAGRGEGARGGGQPQGGR
ncbi:hypothetical protein G6F63_014593 [Rhizopus arrhizus]|nr:hypothetical protein G6F63_014593 [Rhizopus arrhizus]